MDIFEANNPKDIAEPRASVFFLHVNRPWLDTKAEWESGPCVKLTVGKHAFFLTPKLAETLSEELRIAAGMCKVAEGEYGEIKTKMMQEFAAKIDAMDFESERG